MTEAQIEATSGGLPLSGADRQLQARDEAARNIVLTPELPFEEPEPAPEPEPEPQDEAGEAL